MASERQHLRLDLLAHTLSTLSPPVSLFLHLSYLAEPLHYFTLHPNLYIFVRICLPSHAQPHPCLSLSAVCFAAFMLGCASSCACLYPSPAQIENIMLDTKAGDGCETSRGFKPSTQFRCIISPGGGQQTQQTECSSDAACVCVPKHEQDML